MKTDYEITIIGAGIVGLAIAERLSRTSSSILVIEKESSFGQGTSSRNSEVIHSGVYYESGSLKSRLCKEGRRALYALAEQGAIEAKKTGKLIVATTEEEAVQLKALYRNGQGNGVEGLELLSAQEAHILEPEIQCTAAILSEETGILSAHSLMSYLHRESTKQNVDFSFFTTFLNGKRTNDGWEIAVIDADTTPCTFTSRYVINCAGLSCDKVAAGFGMDVEKAGYTIHFAKGCYCSLKEKKLNIQRLIYPVPSKEYLGIHLVVDMAGKYRFGPDISFLKENIEDFSLPNDTVKSFSAAVNRYIPALSEKHLSPDFAGIRPKLSKKGEPSKDFIIAEESERGFPGLINLIGIESPGLTSSLAIAEYVKSLL